MKKKFSYYICIAIIAFFTLSCHDENSTPDDSDVMQGGATTVEGNYIGIFQQPAANLDDLQAEHHRLSDVAFGDIFVTSPSTINPGLGPLFNQNSCESCHLSNGRSTFPDNSDNLKGLLMRISIPGEDVYGGPNPVPGFGTQLGTKSVFGIAKEGTLTWTEIHEIEHYVDGTSVDLRHFEFQITSAYTNLPSDILLSPRIAPAVIGLGLLEAVPESKILALADPNDSNGDGISGRINIVWDAVHQEPAVGRFGWKASSASLLQQTAAAYLNDMGITNPIFTAENCFGQAQCDSLQDDPEIDMTTLQTAAFYPQSLCVPSRRNWDQPEVRRGKDLFEEIQCATCHHPSFTTGEGSENNFLRNQVIYPHTDMLLHDMGEGLADHRPDFLADGNEWRTPPLWGIGLTQIVGGHQNFLHDGRAQSLEEAILWHGGEAQKSKDNFKALSKSERQDLLRYLESL